MLADPEGNEFCVIEPGNKFLADCGFIGALSCSGSQEVGVLLERGAGLAAGLGPGPGDRDPLTPRRSEDHLGRSATDTEDGEEPAALRPGATCRRGDHQAVVEWLVSLGATRSDIGQGEVDWVVLADPDDNEFCVLPPTGETTRS